MRAKRKIAERVSINSAIESVARAAVNGMIESGMTTADMKDRRVRLVALFGDFMLRDICAFADTGRYPEYAEWLNADGTEKHA